MKILITGINGLLGKDIGFCLGLNSGNTLYGIGRTFECRVPNIKYTRLDISHLNNLAEYLRNLQPDVIVHCAAVSKIESCEANHEYAKLVNVDATRLLAQHNCRMIYISSDAVFDGLLGNYSEEAKVSPISFYGQTKYMGEEETLKNNVNSVILRTSMYGYNINTNVSLAQWAANNIKGNTEFKGFNDVITNPMYTKQIAEVISHLLTHDFTGILNLGCNEQVSRYDFFCMLARKMCGNKDIICSVSVDSMNFKVPRTKNTVLSVSKLKNTLDLNFSIEDGLDNFFLDYLKWI